MTAPLRVLYVDDEPDLLVIGKLFLEQNRDFSVVTIDSATAALELLKIEQFDAIISDYQMAGMDGIQFLKTVRNSGNNIPFILFTGKGREDVVIQALNEGADFYLQKGGDPKAQFVELNHKIKMAVYRKWAEKALNQSEERFRSVMNQLPGTVWAVDRDLRFTLSQGAGLVKIGLKPDEAVGKTLYEFFHTSDPTHPEISHHLRALTGQPTMYDYTHEGISFRTYLSPLYDAKGAIKGVTGLAFDITEHMRAEAALRESEKRYRNVVEDQTELISRFLPDGTHIFVNEAYCRYFGLARNDILGHRFRPKIPSEDRERLNQFFKSLTQDNPVDTIEHRIIMPDGSLRWQRWIDRVIFDGSGTKTEYQSVGRDVTEIKEAEEERLKSERKFRLLFDNAILGIFQTTPGGKYINVNPAFARIYGYHSPEEMKSAISDIQKQLYIHPEDRQTINKLLSTIGEVRNFETENRHRDGHSIWISINAKVVRDNNGEILAYEGTIDDITERKRAENALRGSETQYRSLVDSAPIGIGISDLGGNILDSNPSMLRITGYSLEEFKKVNVRDTYVNPNDRQNLITSLQETGEISDYEVELKRKDGTRYYALLNSRIIDINGQRLVLTTTLDITERKHLEEKLLQSEAKHRTLVETSPDILWEIDTLGNFVYLSPQIKEILGYSSEDLMGKPIFSLLPPESISESKNSLFTHIKTRNRLHTLELPASHCDRRRRIIEIRSAALFDHTGKVTGFRGIARDITERKLAEDALRESEGRYKALSEATTDFVFSCIKPEGGTYSIDWIAGAVERITGYTIDELRAMGCWRCLVHPDDTSVFDENITNLPRGTSGTCTLRIRTKSGTERWLAVNTTRMPTKDSSKISHVFGDCRNITDRKRAEAASTESYATFRTVMDSLDALVYVADMKTFEILFVNLYGRKIWGDLTGKICWESLQADQKGPCPFCTNEKLVDEDGLPTGIIVWEFRNTITGQWYECHDSAIQWTDGRIVRLEIATDITGRKRVQEALAESEAFNRGLVENLPDYIAVYGMDGKLIYVNPAAARTLGYDADTLIGTHVLSYIAEEYHETVIAKMTARKEGGEVSPYEIEMVTRNGLRRSVIVKATPIQYQNNPAILLLLIDITDRQMAEEALQRSEEKFRQLFTQMPSAVAIYEADEDGNDFIFKNFNTAAEKIEGIKKEDLLGKRVSEVFPGVKDFGVFSVFQRVWKTGEPEFFPSAVYRDERDSGTWRESWVYRLGGGEVIAIYNDITERKLAEKALEQANRKLTLLTSITRHDILNQLTVLIGHLELLERKQPDPLFTTYFNKISKAADRINAMIRFTKEYESIGVHAPTWQDCRKLVDTAAKQAPLGIVMVKNDLPAGTEVLADPLIVKVFYNLMDNAVRYGGKITTIGFSVEDDGDETVLVCEDDGEGIVAAEKEKIFERGFGKNTGMGLALSREILSITGITITETGEHGKGARFEMAVPKGAWRIAGKSA